MWKFSPIAASLVIVVSLAAIFGSNPSWFNHSGNNGVVVAPDETSNNPAVQTPATDNGYQADSSIRGLPVENFNLADVQNETPRISRGFPYIDREPIAIQ